MPNDLIHIYTAPDKGLAEMMKGFLEGYGIKTFIKGDPGSTGAFLGEFGGYAPISSWLVYVLKDDASEAQNLLQEFEEQEFSSGVSKEERSIGYKISKLALIIALAVFLGLPAALILAIVFLMDFIERFPWF